jgi:predicted small lipoprotein YifL
MLSRTKFIALAGLSLTAAACGLKGPLYRPDEPQTETPSSETAQPAAEDSASAAKKKDPTSVSPPDPDRPAVPPER